MKNRLIFAANLIYIIQALSAVIYIVSMVVFGYHWPIKVSTFVRLGLFSGLGFLSILLMSIAEKSFFSLRIKSTKNIYKVTRIIMYSSAVFGIGLLTYGLFFETF